MLDALERGAGVQGLGKDHEQFGLFPSFLRAVDLQRPDVPIAVVRDQSQAIRLDCADVRIVDVNQSDVIAAFSQQAAKHGAHGARADDRNFMIRLRSSAGDRRHRTRLQQNLALRDVAPDDKKRDHREDHRGAKQGEISLLTTGRDDRCPSESTENRTQSSEGPLMDAVPVALTLVGYRSCRTARTWWTFTAFTNTLCTPKPKINRVYYYAPTFRVCIANALAAAPAQHSTERASETPEPRNCDSTDQGLITPPRL